MIGETVIEENYDRKRRRTRTSRFDFDLLDNEEQKLIQQAIRNSQRDKRRVEYDIPMAPTFYPTVDEFRDPLAYIKSIVKEAQDFGICKIVPPEQWNPNLFYPAIDFQDPRKFPTRLQHIHKLQESAGYGEGKDFTMKSYKEMADKFRKEWGEKYYTDNREMSYEELARDYWTVVETSSKEIEVEYANDIEILKYRSGFVSPRNSTLNNHVTTCDGVETHELDESEDGMFSKAYYARTGWNLINLPMSKGSLLKHLQTPVNGVNIPWLYIGSLFSTFCWHNEDNYLYSINYSHVGEVKQWYGCPGSQARNFEKVAKESLLELFVESPDLLQHMTTQISPSLLYGNGIPVYQTRQEAKSFIITFPKAFHCGFSYGFNCGEAVNFALDDWLGFGGEAEEKYRLIARQSVFSHQRLLFTLFENIKKGNIVVDKSTVENLKKEILKIIEEELFTRPYVYSQGVKDLTSFVTLPRNDFSVISNEAIDFDELRICHVCKHTCLFSAIACECDNSLVSCMRHLQAHCKCGKSSKNSKFMLVWENDEGLKKIQKAVKDYRC